MNVVQPSTSALAPRGRASRVSALAAACLVLAPVAPAAAAEPSLSVSAGRSQLYLGESVVLTVRTAGVDDPSVQPDLSALGGAAIRPLGSHSVSRQSVTIINGRVSRDNFEGREYSYEVTPSAVGRLRLGPVHVRVKGRQLTDAGPWVTVSGVEKQDLVDVQVQASRTTLLVEEGFDITLTVRIRALPPPHAEYQPLDPNNPPQLRIPYLDAAINGLQGPDTRSVLQGILAQQRRQPGFRINDFTVQNDPFGNMFNFNFSINDMQPRPAVFALSSRRIEVGGRPVWEYTLTTHYVPKDEGEYTFGPLQFKGPVITGATADGTPAMRDVFAVGPAVTVRVVPPPEEQRPDAYAGVLGTNMTVEASLDTQTCNVGDPLRLTLSVSGDVNLDRLRLPPVWERREFASLFRAYPDTLQTRRETGRIDYSLTVRPTQAGTIEVPAIALAYFNTATRQYAEARSRPIPLQVNESTVLTPDHVISLGTNTTESATGAAATRRPPAPITLSVEGPLRQSLLGGVPQIAVAAAGPSVFALTGAWVAVAAVVRRRSRSARRRHALRRALHALRADAVPGAGAQNLCLAVSQALRQYVSDRDPAAPEGLTPADCRQRLAAAGVDAEAAARYLALLTRMVEGSFSASASDAGRAEVQQAEAALRDLDRAWRHAERSK